MQAFVAGPIGQSIFVSVEYNADRHVSAVRIAPSDPATAMDPAAVSPLSDFHCGSSFKSGGQPTQMDCAVSTSDPAPLLAPDIESRFGPALIERFILEPGIGVTATYDETRTATQIAIAPPQFMRQSDAERITGEVAPPWARNGSPSLMNMHSTVTSFELRSSTT